MGIKTETVSTDLSLESLQDLLEQLIQEYSIKGKLNQVISRITRQRTAAQQMLRVKDPKYACHALETSVQMVGVVLPIHMFVGEDPDKHGQRIVEVQIPYPAGFHKQAETLVWALISKIIQSA